MVASGRPAPPEPSSDHHHQNYKPVTHRWWTISPRALTLYDAPSVVQP